LILRHLESSEDGVDDEKFEFLGKYLATFSATDEELVSAKERVKTLIIDLIKDPHTSRIDNILQYPVVTQLKDDQAYAKVYQLLKIFAGEGAAQYMELYHQDPQFFTETLGLAHEETLTKIRLLSILSLGATKDVLTYSEVSQITGVEKQDIEMLVVEGITRGIFDARLDQLQNTVIVRHAEPRSYEDQHWQRLDQRLSKWKTNLVSVLDVIRSAKSQLSSTTNQ